jgi:hypothetical protein
MTTGALKGDWQLVVATEGGSLGRGLGGVEARSTGELWISPYVGHRCEFKLSPAELERLFAAVSAARPKGWRPRYVRADNPTGCCDQVRTLVFLNVKRGDREIPNGTGWFDDSRKLAPIDAQRLAAAATVLMRTHPCKPRR